MVAFVRDHQAIATCQLGDVGAPGQRLQGGDVDGPAEFGPAAAELAGLQAEELADTGPPLVGQGLGSTRMSVDVACVAITAQAMTVDLMLIAAVTC